MKNLPSLLNNVDLKIPEVSRKTVPRNEFSSMFKRHARKRKGVQDEEWKNPDSDFDENDSPKLKRKNKNKLVKYSLFDEERKICEIEQLKANLKKKINGYMIFRHTVMPELRALGTASYANHLL